MTNRFDQFAPLTFNLPETPLEPLAGALQAKQQMYDTSQNLADDLANQYIDALQQDQGRANALTSGWQQSIDAMVENYNGDYSQMYGELRGLKRDITKAFSPQGEAGAIQANKKAYVTALENERKRLEKGEITQQQLQSWGSYTLGNYKGVGDADPMTGAYNQLNPESIAKYVDGEKIAREAAEAIKAQEGGTEIAYSNGRYIMKKGDKWEVLPAERIQSVVASSLGNNLEWNNYIQQFARHKGIDGNALSQMSMASYMDQMGKTYAIDNKWHTEDMKVDGYGLLAAKKSMIDEMMAPRGATRPGLTQSRDINKFKMADPTIAANVGSIKQSPGAIEAPNQRISTADESTSQYWSRMKKDERFEKAPLLKKAWDKAYADAASDPRYADMTDQERKSLLVEKYNEKVDNMPLNYESTMASFMPSAAKEMTSLVKSRGASDAASWFKVEKDGLGVRAKENPVKQAMNASDDADKFISATDVATIDGTTGVVTVVNGETWLGVGIMDDRQSAAINPAAKMDDLYRTGSTSFDFLMPAFDNATGQYQGITPNRMKFEGTIDGDGNMSGNLVQIDNRGQVIQTIAEGMSEKSINDLRSMLVEAGSAELNSNLDVSSQQIEYGDPKARFDRTPMINMILD